MISGIQPAERLSIAGFAERFVSLPAAYTPPGPFRVNRSRYLVEPWEALMDSGVREITVLKATQTGGSLVGDIWATWSVRVEPAPMLMNMQTDDDAKDHATFRIKELMENCQIVREVLPEGHKGKTKRTVQMLKTDFMWMLIQGANLSNLQSKSVCKETNDEIVFWQPDSLLKDAYARTSAFNWRKKIYNVSQGGLVGDEMDRKWKAGSMKEWSFQCPKCGFPQPFRWTYNNDPKARGGMKWEKSDVTRPGGEWDYEQLAASIHFECRECGHGIEDNLKNREQLSDSGHYVPGNLMAPPTSESFTWNAMACEEIPWIDLVWEFLTEVIPEYRQGNREPLQKFIQKRLAQADDEGVNWFDTQTVNNSDYSLDENGDPPPWPEEAHRFMAIDKQIDHYWYVARAFSAMGTSRFLACGRAISGDELDDIRERLKIRHDHTVIDSGKWATEVYMLACQYGWRCLKGEDDKSFLWRNEKGEKVYRPYSEPIKRDPIFGMNHERLAKDDVKVFRTKRKFTNAVLCRWSNPAIKDLLSNLRAGQGLYYGVPSNVAQEYLDQMNGEQRFMKIDKMTGKKSWIWKKVGRKGDHMRDCELMILVIAAIRGLLMGRTK